MMGMVGVCLRHTLRERRESTTRRKVALGEESASGGLCVSIASRYGMLYPLAQFKNLAISPTTCFSEFRLGFGHKDDLWLTDNPGSFHRIGKVRILEELLSTLK
jgi:hypothetical protein